MKRRRVFVAAIILLLVAIALAPLPALAWHHTRVVVGFGVGPFWWGGPYPFWGYPYWWDYPPYVYAPPPVIVREPPVYVQQEAPPPPEPPAGPYWYYCPSAGAYYPSVPQCPEPWVKVPPRPAQ
jgi:hypothetical protein